MASYNPAEYGYTGGMFERDFIGRVIIDAPEYRNELQHVQHPDGYVPFRPAIELVKRFQPWDPTNPKKDFSRDLRIEIIDVLGLKPGEYNCVKCYTAVGTPLDYLHGIDGFLEIEDPKARTVRRVTFDLSLRDKGEQKADVLISDLPDPQEESTTYLAAIEKYGKRVADILTAATPEPLTQ